MKRLLSGLLFTAALLFVFPLSAQLSINEQLRSLLSGLALAPGGYNAPFLYDMAVHTSDEAFYTPICMQTSNYKNWWNLYFEMSQSSYTPGFLPDVGALMDAADARINNDTIPIGIMDFEYNQFDSLAFDSSNNGVWFSWTNDTIVDVTGRQSSPYLLNAAHTPPDYLFGIFAASPLSGVSKYGNVTFAIDPQFIFYGTAYNRNVQPSPIHTMQIDLDDGHGWQTINPATLSFMHTYYNNAGDHIIKCQVLDHGGNVIKYSQSVFKTRLSIESQYPDQWLNLPGINAGVYFGCGHDSIKKPLIYLEGIDILENRHVPEIYTEMINEENLLMLRDFGYDIIVVDWKDSRQSMEDNAAHIINLLEYLQTIVPGNEQNVLIGESMGGVIGRYALTVMENSAYIAGDGVHPPHPKSHNTRLFVTIDAPQQGAFVPLSAQHLVDMVYAFPGVLARTCFFIYDLTRQANILSTNILSRPAVKQLLVEHAQAGDQATVDRNAFISDLFNLNPSSGGYPIHCKKIAISNGLIDSSRQIGFGDRILQPGDVYLNLSMSTKAKFMHLFTFDLLDLSGSLNANPVGSGSIMSMSIGYPVLHISGCLLNIFRLHAKKLPCGFTMTTIPFNYNVSGVKPYDVMPGGYMESVGSTIFENKAAPLSFNFFDLFSFNYTKDPSTGTITMSSTVAWLLNKSTTISCQIANFDFVPVFSTFDYNPPAGTPMDHDLLHENINTLLSRTPFDVIVGNVKSNDYPELGYWFLGSENSPHLNFRDDGTPNYDHSTWLNNEIGDDDLKLDNADINRDALFDAPDRINAGNAENAFYKYPSTIIPEFTGMFSKQNDFIVDASGGNVEFKAGGSIALHAGFQAQHGCTFLAHIVPIDTCDLSFKELGGGPLNTPFVSVKENDKENAKGVRVFPNPSGQSFTIQLPANSPAKGEWMLYNSMGQLLESNSIQQTEWSIDASDHQLNTGMYILIIKNNNEIYTEKLLLNK
jgi:hypothetical protein